MSAETADATRDSRPRRRGRKAGPKERSGRHVSYRNLVNSLQFQPAYSEDQIQQIHQAALTVLEELGVRILHDDARRRLAQAGAAVKDLQVRFDRGMVEAAIASSPNEFTMRSGSGPVRFGGRNTLFMPVGGPPHAMDLDRGKRPGTLEDYRNFIKLSQAYDVIHIIGPSVEPQDVPPALRHYEMVKSFVFDSDKPAFVYSRGKPQVMDAFEMYRIRYGLDDAAFTAEPWVYTVINTNSPLILDIPMCQGMIDFAEQGQISIITPFTLSGAMAPVTIPGALVQQHAEMLSGLVLTQTVRPGAPVVYGGFTTNVDMKSGAPAFGTPETIRAAWGTGQLARLVGLPWRSSMACTSNTPDAQAAYESQMSLWGSMLGGANVMIHSAGWLEGGLSASYEKFVIDVEMLQQMAELFQPRPFDEGELGLEAIRTVGSGGHHFGTPHTLERYETAFYSPFVSDWSNFGAWQEAGAKTAAERANTIWKDVLERFEPPPVDPGIREAVDAFVAKRTAEGGAPPES